MASKPMIFYSDSDSDSEKEILNLSSDESSDPVAINQPEDDISEIDKFKDLFGKLNHHYHEFENLAYEFIKTYLGEKLDVGVFQKYRDFEYIDVDIENLYKEDKDTGRTARNVRYKGYSMIIKDIEKKRGYETNFELRRRVDVLKKEEKEMYAKLEGQ